MMPGELLLRQQLMLLLLIMLLVMIQGISFGCCCRQLL
jgi:hypothetical protein